MRKAILTLSVILMWCQGCSRGSHATTIVSDVSKDELEKRKLDLEGQKLQLEIEELSDRSHWYSNTYFSAAAGVLTALILPLAVAAWKVYTDRKERRRIALADFGGTYSTAVHAMAWYTWKQSKGIAHVKAIDEYDSEMHALLPALCGSLLKASAYDRKVYTLLAPFFDKVLQQDLQIANENIRLRKNISENVTLERLHGEVLKLWDEISPRGFDLA
jgi:hypothetical protein